MSNPIIQVHAPAAGLTRQVLPLRGTPSPDDGLSAALQVQLLAATSQGGALAIVDTFTIGADGIAAPVAEEVLGAVAFSQVFNGNSWDRLREASQQYVTAGTSEGAALVALPGEKTAIHVPAAATRATVTVASPGPTTALVARSITACAVNDATASTQPMFAYLRDGATGVGAILWAGVLRGGATAQGSLTLTGLNIVGTPGNSMTLEFDVAPDAGHNQTVSLGYSEAIASP